MKPNTVRGCVVLLSIAAFLNSSTQAATPSRVLAKVQFERYTGPQQDWPRSTERVALIKTNHGMPIYEKLPDRPYEVLGIMSDDGDHAVKHVAEAARVVGADAVLVVGDKTFKDAGLNVGPSLLENASVPDPRGPTTISRLEHPEALKTGSQESMIRVTKIVSILIRWKTK